MTQILRFAIAGLAGRGETIEYVLNTDVNVFWGLNGSGKTSLLRILHGALSNDAAPLVRVPFEEAFVEFYSADHDAVVTRQLGKSSKQRIDIEEYEQMLAHRERFDMSPDEWELLSSAESLRWATNPPDLHRPFKHGYLPINRLTERARRPGVRRPARREVLDEASYDQAFADEIDSLWQRYNATSLTRIREVQQRGLADVLDVVLNGVPKNDSSSQQAEADEGYELVTTFLKRQRIRSPLSFKKFESRYAQDANLRAVVARISRVNSEIEEASLPQQRLQDLVQGLMSGNKEVAIQGRSLSVKSEEEDIPVTGLSSGEKQLLLILLECMAAETNSLIIDEPELSMHVDWQHDLLAAMTTVNPEAQIIVATHSPEVMAEIADEKIFQL